MEIWMMTKMMIRWKFKNRDRASPIGPGTRKGTCLCTLSLVTLPRLCRLRPVRAYPFDQLLNSTNHMPRYGLGKLTSLVSTRLGRHCCTLPRDYNACGL